MTFDTKDYLDEDEMKSIARQAFKEHCLDKFREDHERIFGNVAHKMVWEEVDKAVEGDIAEIIAKRVKAVMQGISLHTIFRPKNVWEKSDSAGQIEMNRAVSANRDIINTKVVEAAAGITTQMVFDAMADGDFNFTLSPSKGG